MSDKPKPGFTPGPWEWDGTQDSHLRYGDLIGDTRSVIHADDYYLDFASDDDARLIAAAPDLYAACEEAATELQWAYQQLGQERCYRAIQTMKAALAKANGQTEEPSDAD